MTVYRDKVRDHFCAGTFRFGHLDNLSLVGTASEEAGGFFPDILDMLDEIPILSLVSFFYKCSKNGTIKHWLFMISRQHSSLPYFIQSHACKIRILKFLQYQLYSKFTSVFIAFQYSFN